jgi:hypothetical protein
MRYVHIDRLVDPQKKQTRYSVCHASAWLDAEIVMKLKFCYVSYRVKKSGSRHIIRDVEQILNILL